MKFSTFFSPIASAFRAAVLALSKVDGNPGLSADDFAKVIQWSIDLRSSSQSNSNKAAAIAKAITAAFGTKIAAWPWVSYAIGWIGHLVAKRISPEKK